MNLRELSELVQVTVHLKTVINSAGYTKFNNTTMASLKKKMAEFDELFVSEVLNYESKNDAKMIHDAVQEARQKMGLDQRYPTAARPAAQLQLEDDESENKAWQEAAAVVEKEHALTKLQEAAKKAPVTSGKKGTVRRNAAPVRPTEEVASVNEPVEEVASAEKVKKEEQPKTVATPSPNQPYMEDQSLAALLAAERQKVAAKKRK